MNKAQERYNMVLGCATMCACFTLGVGLTLLAVGVVHIVVGR